MDPPETGTSGRVRTDYRLIDKFRAVAPIRDLLGLTPGVQSVHLGDTSSLQDHLLPYLLGFLTPATSRALSTSTNTADSWANSSSSAPQPVLQLRRPAAMSELPLQVPSLGRDTLPRAMPRDAPFTAPDADAAPATSIKGDNRAEAVPDAEAVAGRRVSLPIRTRQPSREAKKHVDGSVGPFFEVLSSDLRYQIYQLAFGRKILHLYLLYRRSLQPDVRWRKGHQPVPAWYPHSPSVSPMDPPFADASMTPQWYWWSCVCGPEDRKLETKLSDQCPRGFYQTCGPKETYLGILPWLLTCRRA